MGKINQGILGGVSGQVGNVIGASWKGIDYIRIKPVSVADPQTDNQLNYRQKFSVTMAFLQPLSEFLRTGFKQFAVKMSGINAGMSYNSKNALTGTYPNLAVDYPNALVARGGLAPALNPLASSTVAGTIVFAWDDNSGEVGASTLDKSLLVVFNPAKHQAVTVNELADRGDVTQTITVPDSWSGDLVQCYIAFIKTDGSLNSNSSFSGAVSVA